MTTTATGTYHHSHLYLTLQAVQVLSQLWLMCQIPPESISGHLLVSYPDSHVHPPEKRVWPLSKDFLFFFERTLNDVMRACHVTNTRFRSGFLFCILCARTHAHTVPPATLFLEEPSDSDGDCKSLLFLVFR